MQGGGLLPPFCSLEIFTAARASPRPTIFSNTHCKGDLRVVFFISLVGFEGFLFPFTLNLSHFWLRHFIKPLVERERKFLESIDK